MRLHDLLITSPVRCAPPGNKPGREELNACSSFLMDELSLLTRIELVIALGGIAWNTYLGTIRHMGFHVPSPKPRFGHLAVVTEGLPHQLLGSFHPSRLNTQTGRLTEAMLDSVFTAAMQRLGRREERVP